MRLSISLALSLCALGLTGLTVMGCQQRVSVSAKQDKPMPVTPIASQIPNSLDQVKPMAKSSGAALFAQNCAGCHGINGKGTAGIVKQAGVDLSSKRFQKTLSDAELTSTIQNGKGMMPAFAGTFDKAQLASLKQYVRSLAKS